MQQEVVLAMLAKEPSHGYELRARMRAALGPLGDAMNPGQVYVTLTRLERAGLVASERADGLEDRPDRKVYLLTPEGQQRVAGVELELHRLQVNHTVAVDYLGRYAPNALALHAERHGRVKLAGAEFSFN